MSEPLHYVPIDPCWLYRYCAGDVLWCTKERREVRVVGSYFPPTAGQRIGLIRLDIDGECAWSVNCDGTGFDGSQLLEAIDGCPATGDIPDDDHEHRVDREIERLRHHIIALENWTRKAIAAHDNNIIEMLALVVKK